MTEKNSAEPQTPSAIEGLFKGSDWIRVYSDTINTFWPNRLYHNSSEKLGAIVIERSERGDFALSEAALRYVSNALVKGERTIEAYIVLKERNGTDVLAFRPVRDVEKALAGVQTLDGRRGAYWWIDANFQAANLRRGVTRNEEPM